MSTWYGICRQMRGEELFFVRKLEGCCNWVHFLVFLSYHRYPRHLQDRLAPRCSVLGILVLQWPLGCRTIVTVAPWLGGLLGSAFAFIEWPQNSQSV
jgi:hypothetical protein